MVTSVTLLTEICTFDEIIRCDFPVFVKKQAHHW